MNVVNPDAAAIEESNALALAIVPTCKLICRSHFFIYKIDIPLFFLCLVDNYFWGFHSLTAVSSDSGAVQAKDFDPSGWELALVTTPSNNNTPINERQLVSFLPCCLQLL